MERYKNFGGNSSVIAYEIEPDSITIQFNDGWLYLYTIQSAGSGNITEMHHLAAAGQGLNSFISRVVRKKFARKWR